MSPGDYARDHGWRVSKTRGGHLCFQKGSRKIFAASTPSDHRAARNQLAQLRRADRIRSVGV